MGTTYYEPEQIVAKLQQADVLISQGQNIVDAIRQIGVSEVTYYRWRRDFGGLKPEQVKRLQNLELENIRLRKAISELTLDKLILQEVRAQLLHLSEHRANAAPPSDAKQLRLFDISRIQGGNHDSRRDRRIDRYRTGRSVWRLLESRQCHNAS